MKKLVAITALFLAFGLSSTEATAKKDEQSCMSNAWDFGTRMDGADGHSAYYWTDLWYSSYCS